MLNFEFYFTTIRQIVMSNYTKNIVHSIQILIGTFHAKMVEI